MVFKIQVASKDKVGFGAGPNWSVKENALYYTNCYERSFVKLDWERKEQCETKLKNCHSKFINTIFPISNRPNGFLVSSHDRLVQFESQPEASVTGELTTLTQISDGFFDEGICDPVGRLWIGAWKIKPNSTDFDFERFQGGLCSLAAGKFKRETSGMSGPNGISFSPDNKIMCTVDCNESTIGAQEFDYQTGWISEHRKTIFTLDPSKLALDARAIPEGLVTDVKGNLWVTAYMAGKVHNIDVETGKITNEVKIETPLTTSLCFGGKELNELFVTSCSVTTPGYSDDVQVGEFGGHTFRVVCEKDNSFKGFAPYEYIC